MDKYLRPERLDADPNSSSAAQQWRHWNRTFTSFLSQLEGQMPNKLDVLINYVSPRVYDYIAECETYDDAVSVLESLYVKPKNEIFARHLLATRKQEAGESLDQYLQSLQQLSRDCNFKAVSAEQARDELIRDAFINGLSSVHIRQRLLENKTLDLRTAVDQARALESAQRHSESYHHPSYPVNASTSVPTGLPTQCDDEQPTAAATGRPPGTQLCFFCGMARHPRFKCPARAAKCGSCGKTGHFAKVCRSGSVAAAASASEVEGSAPTLAASSISSASPGGLSKATLRGKVNSQGVDVLIDTGSSQSFVSLHVVKRHKWKVLPASGEVLMASTTHTSKVHGYCLATIQLPEHCYTDVKLTVLPDLCADVILGHDVLHQHSSVEIPFGGSRPSLTVCGLATMAVPLPTLFGNLTSDCRPIAVKSRRYTTPDAKFIESEVRRMQSEGIIEPSQSPWRAQVLVTANENHKKRLVIDYSQTINRFTQLDAYPLPNMEKMVGDVARYKVFSTLDLRSAYHQIPIRDEEKKYTAFEADGKLFQFTRIPFGVTNGVAAFQRVMDTIVSQEGLSDTFVYLDNITVCGRDQAEHDENLQRLLKVAKKCNLTFNEDKCVYSVASVNLLGYVIGGGTLRPDPERLRPLQELPPPHDTASLQRVLGMFAHYSHWIHGFSEKIRPLVQTHKFPLQKPALDAFQLLKQNIADATMSAIRDDIPFVVETDASDHAIAATLCQDGRPVAFFSRTLSSSERNHSAVEKEAYAIVEALRRWKHFLLGRQFKLITDQRSVAFMFDGRQVGKVKNEKIMRWRLELSSYCYDIIYRPGTENASADALSRSAVCSASDNRKLLVELHSALCHPGVTRMTHFVRTRNLPFSVEEIKQMTASCPVCAECKPRYGKPPEAAHLIKATQPFERLNMDFKGPLPSATRNKYMLTVVDEFSRFPFVFPCADITSSTVIGCLCQLFAIFGMPAYVHSDRGSSFMSAELKSFLFSKGIATSRTTAYNPEGNGQVERYNGIIWKAVSLALRSRGLPVERWEVVLPDALHSVRSLLSTATNETPHERLFRHQRRSTSGNSVPTWLSKPGDVVLMKRHVRQKYDPLVDEVELLEANPQYAHVRLPDGRETTVSIRHLAPRGTECLPGLDTEALIDKRDGQQQADTGLDSYTPSGDGPRMETPIAEPDPVPPLSSSQTDVPTSQSQSRPEPPSAAPEPAPVRRSSRVTRRPVHLERDYVM